MKTLTEVQCTVTGDDITIKAKIKDLPFSGLLVTRVSHGHVNPENPKHPRRIQSSNEAVFCESPSTRSAIPNSELAKIFAAIDPLTSFPPALKPDSKPGCVCIASEIPHAVQWQVSDAAFPMALAPDTAPPKAVWLNIDGATDCRLDDSNVKVGQWIRCVITNDAGTTITQPAQKK